MAKCHRFLADVVFMCFIAYGHTADHPKVKDTPVFDKLSAELSRFSTTPFQPYFNTKPSLPDELAKALSLSENEPCRSFEQAARTNKNGNTLNLATHMKRLAVYARGKSCETAISQFLDEIDKVVCDLQQQQIPDHAPLRHYESLNASIEKTGDVEGSRAFINVIFAFKSCYHFDYFMYGMVSRHLTRQLSQLIQSFSDARVLEVMAGAGWFYKALNEAGIDILSSDNFSLPNNTYITRADTFVFNMLDILEDNKRFSVLPSAEVKKADAQQALKDSDRKILLISYPEPEPQYLEELLELCQQKETLILHLSHVDETFNAFLEDVANKRFIPVIDGSQLFSGNGGMNVIEIGFWGTIPDWYSTEKNAIATQLKKFSSKFRSI